MLNTKSNKKGQIGLITGLVFGIASLVIGVIIAFVIVSTLTDADLLSSAEVTTAVVNETGTLNVTAGTETLDEVTVKRHGYALTALWGNSTTDYETIPLVNASVSSAGVVTSIAGTFFTDGLISYTYITYTNEDYSSSLLAGNFTEGVDNVSDKIPTVLLVAAIVLILGVLVLLVGTWQRMRIGGGSI